MILRTFAFVAWLGMWGLALAADDGRVDAVVNVDIMPTDQSIGARVLADYIKQATQDPTVLSSRLLQQTVAANHFILEETFPSQGAYRRHIEAPYVRSFRAALYPHLGSPWDERLGKAIAETSSQTHAIAR